MEKPSHGEDEYFAKEEAEKLKRLALKRHNELEEHQKEELKKLHWLHCGYCGAKMDEIIFKGVAIHKCFQCGSVLLNDGELEKLSGTETSFFEGLAHLFGGKADDK